jgi:hypothetical protein
LKFALVIIRFSIVEQGKGQPEAGKASYIGRSALVGKFHKKFSFQKDIA